MKEPLVLLVEDNPHIMDINTAALTMRGCRVLQAATVQACREQLRLHDVELIVLDILLPDGDGLTLCREIKENYDIPILFLSALGENEDIVQGLTAGGDDYLPKPYDLNVLVARVEARLRAGQRMRRCVHCGPLKLYLLSSKAYLGADPVRVCRGPLSGPPPGPDCPGGRALSRDLAAAHGRQPPGPAHDHLPPEAKAGG